MLKEGYLAKKKTYPKDEIQIIVTATAKSVLAPSWDLLNDYKAGKVDCDGYIRRFTVEMMTNPEAIKEMRRIKELVKTKNVRLICYEKEYPCHRYILIELINELIENTVQKCVVCGYPEICHYNRCSKHCREYQIKMGWIKDD